MQILMPELLNMKLSGELKSISACLFALLPSKLPCDKGLLAKPVHALLRSLLVSLLKRSLFSDPPAVEPDMKALEVQNEFLMKMVEEMKAGREVVFKLLDEVLKTHIKEFVPLSGIFVLQVVKKLSHFSQSVKDACYSSLSNLIAATILYDFQESRFELPERLWHKLQKGN